MSVRAEQRDSQWIGKAESEPEFNLSIVAGELFDMSAKEEIDALVGEGLPFGDAAALVQSARNIAAVLDVGVVSDLDPQSLHRQCDVAPGVYNAALWILANDDRGASQSLRDELDELARRQDWDGHRGGLSRARSTASCETRRCILDEPAGRSAPVQRISGISPRPVPARTADHRYRSAGTGKTQLVVNAVTNAWLDGDTVLVASTNNGAVNVAADRANADIGPGTVLRTGNREAREALADRVGKAVGAAAGDEAVENNGGTSGATTAPAPNSRERPAIGRACWRT